jgi:hypothetical protein
MRREHDPGDGVGAGGDCEVPDRHRLFSAVGQKVGEPLHDHVAELGDPRRLVRSPLLEAQVGSVVVDRPLQGSVLRLVDREFTEHVSQDGG